MEPRLADSGKSANLGVSLGLALIVQQRTCHLCGGMSEPGQF